MGNHLYYGDNLAVLRDIANAEVDLIYFDPPLTKDSTNPRAGLTTGAPEEHKVNMTLDRTALMARVRTHDTTPEIVLRRGLHARGLRFRLHRKDLPGTPDIAFPRHRVVIFVHGCFWHGCESCDRGLRRPKTNADFWAVKIQVNRARDACAARELVALGWRVVTVWECAIRKPELLDGEIDRISLVTRGDHGWPGK